MRKPPKNCCASDSSDPTINLKNSQLGRRQEVCKRERERERWGDKERDELAQRNFLLLLLVDEKIGSFKRKYMDVLSLWGVL